MAPSLQSVFWSTFSDVGPYWAHFEERLMVSVVMDADAWKSFSGIRVVIVHQEGAKLRDVRVEEASMDPSSSTRTRLSCRQRLIQESQRLIEAERRLSSTNGHPSALPLCTVVFKLGRDEVLDPPVIVKLPFELRPISPESTTGRLCIAYDRAYPCTKDAHTVFEVLTIQPRWNVNPYASPQRSISPPVILSHHAPHYSLRIIPKQRSSRVTFAELPKAILTQITQYATADANGTGTLMSIGLVCKAWSKMFETFFAFQSFNFPGTLLSAAKIIRGLEFRPERALLLRKLDTRNYHEARGCDFDDLSFSLSVLKILSLATHLEEVTIRYLASSCYDLFFPLLAKLRHLKSCELDHVAQMPEDEDLSSLNIRDVLTAAANWPDLERLDIDTWNDDGDEVSDKPLPLACNLRDLRLKHGQFNAPGLLQFVRTPAPSLHRVELLEVKNLLNVDLFVFLCSVGSTLSHLTVRGCEIRRSTTEEHALDVMIPNLPHLEFADISGDYITATAMARRTWGEPASILISHAPGVVQGGVVAALITGMWKSVSIDMVMDVPWRWLEYAEELADRRGIRFSCFSPNRPRYTFICGNALRSYHPPPLPLTSPVIIVPSRSSTVSEASSE